MARRKRKQGKSQKRQPPRAELRVETGKDDGWTWCYGEPDNGGELYSNETYTTVDAARQWARRAYPDVPLAEDQDG